MDISMTNSGLVSIFHLNCVSTQQLAGAIHSSYKPHVTDHRIHSPYSLIDCHQTMGWWPKSTPFCSGTIVLTFPVVMYSRMLVTTHVSKFLIAWYVWVPM